MSAHYGFGWRRSRADHGHPEFSAMALQLVGTIPNAASLTDAVERGPQILDQVRTSSCVGQSVVGMIETRRAVLGFPVSHRSPIDAYDLARCLERGRDYPFGRMPPLTDVGAMPSDAWDSVRDHGIASYATRPTDEATVNGGPYLDAREEGLLYLVDGAYAIREGNGQTLAVRSSIASGFPVQVCSLVDVLFADWTPDRAPVRPPDPDAILGGHALYAVSYEQVAGKWQYVVVNSWGRAWGASGYLRVSEEWLAQASDMFVGDVRVQEAA